MVHIHKKFHDWRERWRDPTLSFLLMLQLFSLFIATPLAAMDTALPHDLIEIFMLIFIALVVFISREKAEQIMCMLAVIGGIGGRIMRIHYPDNDFAFLLAPLGFILSFVILTYVVGKAVFGPGKVTGHRIRGAIVLYFNLAIIFAACDHLIWDLIPDAYTNLNGIKGQAHQMAAMTYFSLTTLTSTGYGDIVPINPLARSIANMEAVVGQLFPATLLARVVTLAIQHSNDDNKD